MFSVVRYHNEKTTAERKREHRARRDADRQREWKNISKVSIKVWNAPFTGRWGKGKKINNLNDISARCEGQLKKTEALMNINTPPERPHINKKPRYVSSRSVNRDYFRLH